MQFNKEKIEGQLKYE